jgi:hypothetical protein
MGQFQNSTTEQVDEGKRKSAWRSLKLVASTAGAGVAGYFYNGGTENYVWATASALVTAAFLESWRRFTLG